MDDKLIFISHGGSIALAQALKETIEARFEGVRLFLDTAPERSEASWAFEVAIPLRLADIVLALPEDAEEGPSPFHEREVTIAAGRKDCTLLRLAPGWSDWNVSFGALCQSLVKKCGLVEKPPRAAPAAAAKPQRRAPLPADELERLLHGQLRGWRVEFRADPKVRHHFRMALVRRFGFSTFAAAMDFMRIVAAHAEQVQHHPRWTQSWRTVEISLSTWDAEHRITMQDVEFAEYLHERFSLTPV